MASAAEQPDRRLRLLAEQLDGHRWAAELLDTHWRLVWVSEELRAMREDDQAHVPYGQHVLKNAAGFGGLTQPSRERWLRTNGPFMLDGLDGDRQAIAEL